MTRSELYKLRQAWLSEHVKYKLCEWTEFGYKILNKIMYLKRAGGGTHETYNDVIIMADTETSKKCAGVYENHVVAWTISIRAFNQNIVTLYGHRPDDLIECIDEIMLNMDGERTIIYFHNLAYDWVFIRKFLFLKWGLPDKQLNTKSHNPISIEWENGLILKDSYILAQRSLDKWARDLAVEHQKAIGKWDYDKYRNQDEDFSADELEYIEHDTLAGVECLQKTMDALHKRIYSMPYTATGIPREEVRARGKDFRAHDRFLRQALTYEQQVTCERVYHGGYTHANRHLINVTLNERVECFDFASSYPFVMLSEKYPSEAFSQLSDKPIDYIIRNADTYAFMFKLILLKPRLKNDFTAMPALQYSKCVKTVNAVLDNGRILCAEYVEIYLSEQDAIVIAEQYEWNKHLCTNIEYSRKEYLPRWFTDYIFELFKAKTELKTGDKVLYSLAKARLNSCYGMCVQKPVKELIEENYITGEYSIAEEDPRELYEKYIRRYTSVLPYQWGTWVTAYAFRNLFKLGACCGTWVYSDTDSCYGINWDKDKLNAYNEECKQKLRANNYDCVFFNNREYWLGIAEFDGAYSEYRVQGAKRYCGRSVEDNELHITVAGVPKKGAACLQDDIENFTTGLIFDGITTGKKTHTYFYVEEIYTDENGNITGDSIDLSPCDYLLDSVNEVDWQKIFEEEIEVQVYEEE